ncbi:MAG: hypothetical protein H0X17_00065 [Deltaproteobacteria bacterium]|nr:hypothetical protein [Deltaproteobacteria bacterium]
MRLAALLVSMAACVEPAAPIEPQVTSRVVSFDLPVATVGQLDVLFVIDSSPAMRAHRETLAANYRTFMSVLATIGGGLPSLHLGVISADLGTTGAADIAAGPELGRACAGRGNDARLRRAPSLDGDFVVDRVLADRSRVANYEGALADTFADLATIGDEGCELVQPLEAMRRALTAHPELVRPDAHLFVVFLTAQDDCSFPHAAFLDGLRDDPVDTYRCYARAAELVPVAEYVDFLKQLKPDPSMVMIGLASGPASPVAVYHEGPQRFVAPACTLGVATAAPAPRLHQLIDEFPNRSTFTTLCQPDLNGVMHQHGRLLGAPGLAVAVEYACLEPPLADVDSTTAGAQYECAVAYRFAGDRGGALAACAAGETPCWEVTANAAWCPGPPHQLIDIRHGPVELPRGVHVLGQCLLE